MNKYRILILSNMVGSGLKDDDLVRQAFEVDGHIVDLKTVNYATDDEQYDVIIRRNTWVSNEADTPKLYEANQKLIARLSDKQVKTVNLVGLDGLGKQYLCELFANNANVIPTINTMANVEQLGNPEKYVVKDIKSFGNGLYQKFVDADKLKEVYVEGNIIQPFMKFKSEVQCYYVGQQFKYALEYTPSKYPNYPEPKFIQLTEEEKQWADKFANYSGLEHGFLRIDFIRLEDNRLMLMEIEDHAAFMNLQRLPAELLADVMKSYKQNIYDCIQS
ncbi:MAG: hypothetical protein ATN35_03230 [Epulopiscium sp. Nele67-Bin004]|nr:MAG: hypothetical protein ATN35_03230 [Epulopiscium sp. Nele67-Bin004]